MSAPALACRCSTTGSSVNTTTTVVTPYPGATQYNLAWALMAECLARRRIRSWTSGFRLASLGGGSTGAVPVAAGGNATAPISISNIIVPEVRLGMRYKIN